VIDPVATTLDAVARHDLARLPLAVAAGAMTSLGPCVAPRYVAMAAVIERSGQRGRSVLLFISGLLVGYAALGYGVGLLGALFTFATPLYAVLAIALSACGIAQLLRRSCASAHGHGSPVRASGVFSLGAGSALIISPCCTPIVAAIAGMNTLDGQPAVSATFFAAFALGHALPLLLLGATGSFVTARFAMCGGGSGAATISGTLMLALGAYYGVLV